MLAAAKLIDLRKTKPHLKKGSLINVYMHFELHWVLFTINTIQFSVQ